MDDVAVAIEAALAGAAVVRRRFGTRLTRMSKGAGDFATDADHEAEAAMLAVLRRERPADGILAEESGRSGAGGAARTWLVDPLCGTLNFAAGVPVVAVNVALAGGAEFRAAAVADPFAAELFWAGGGSAFRRAGGRDARLVPDASSRLVELNVDPPFPSAPRFRAVRLAADADFTAAFRLRVVSSSIALAWVATGQRAAYVMDGDMRESVHFAAGLALCEAAGCLVTDLGGRPWRGGAGLIAAADAETHERLLALVRRGG